MDERPDGGRHYWLEVTGRDGWRARYIKVVDAAENTVRFYQQIFNARGDLVAIHEKYPIDRGHLPTEGEE